MSCREHRLALEPTTIIMKEYMNLSSALRSYNRSKQKNIRSASMAAILGNGSEVFLDDDDSTLEIFKNPILNRFNDPLLTELEHLIDTVSRLNSLEDMDSRLLLKPFLFIVNDSSMPRNVTSLALDALLKSLHLDIINKVSRANINTFQEIAISLTHPKFGGPNKTQDEALLLKLIEILELVVDSSFSEYLTDEIMYDILQVVLSLACSNKKTEVLRASAESTMISITTKIFQKLHDFNPTNASGFYLNDEKFTRNSLQYDRFVSRLSSERSNSIANPEATATPENIIINTQESQVPESVKDRVESSLDFDSYISDDDIEDMDKYGMDTFVSFLNLLLTLISTKNSTKHTVSTKILSYKLLTCIIEISGSGFKNNPRLLNIMCDPISKCIFFNIRNSNNISLLHATLQLFTTMIIILGKNLKLQIQLTLQCCLDILSDKINKPIAVKELILENLSLLWTNSSSFFISTFIDYDCNLEHTDLSLGLLNILLKLANPKYSSHMTQYIPPLAIDGLWNFIICVNLFTDNLNDQNSFLNEEEKPIILKDRYRKAEFIKCCEKFNKKPKEGISMLISKGFIISDAENDIADFLFNNNNRMNKKTIGLLLCDPKNVPLLENFIDLFNFKSLRIDEALRVMLSKFRLPGESQQIERIVEAFSSKYVKDQSYNPEELQYCDENLNENVYADENDGVEQDFTKLQPDSDSVFIVSYSIIMLNTDLHNPNIKEHMSFADYSGNLKTCYNKSHDFPREYLWKIYCSIRDKEIVMPEEFDGDVEWFDDVWKNLIVSNTVVTEIHSVPEVNVLDELTTIGLAQLGQEMFKLLGQEMVSCLFNLYTINSNKIFSQKLLKAIKHCSSISSFYNDKDLYHNILHGLLENSCLSAFDNTENHSAVKHAEDSLETDEKDCNEEVNHQLELMPLIQINIEETNSKVVVSPDGIKLGESSKGQNSLLLYFKILSSNSDASLLTKETYSDIIQLIITLFENFLLDPNIFPELQNSWKFEKIPSPNATFEINKSKLNKSLLSTFASYLTGDDNVEPTTEDIEYSMKAMECIKSINIRESIFKNKNIVTPAFVELIIESIQIKKKANYDEEDNYFECELIFLLELSLSLMVVNNFTDQLLDTILNKIEDISANIDDNDLSVHAKRKISNYKLVLITLCKTGGESYLLSLISDDLIRKNEVFNEDYFSTIEGDEFISRILNLFTNKDDFKTKLSQNKDFWKWLKLIGSMRGQSLKVYEVLEQFTREDKKNIMQTDFVLILEIIDEIASSTGGNDMDKLDESAREKAIALSLKAIDLSSTLLKENTFESSNNMETLSLIQLLGHQCLNGYEEIQSHALKSLENSILNHLSIPRDNALTVVEEIIDNGLAPILSIENAADSSELNNVVLRIIGKVYLKYLVEGITTNETYMKILKIFNKFVAEPTIENQLLELILEKQRIEQHDVDTQVEA
ncbi:Sec7 domain-containing protein NDAI_0G04900 [Naumovozyma dairenensis CBS 421]|uniref:SEC7 domain-containing protein n=1 Tax=Naumovozyma dairenensis (strain ATCC 10597 / BCRC 20456 / CBS 421 / NBRC 0211 / NRRL Y-12639) TaxID=1071378 RepID=J7SB16_NAUDC|nr:hypothetical protein NDAI_0G04900 [Naumovozyma dairenensis CBS 421]CCK73473.1 hypothetical protein NDAI_0G04900 [Naumovozyma dairenensis CBS 421]